ncbi:hypothetical protein GLOTRDRAFT_71571 [Gloeophyllum trabeum ATCC 11539]|uniref:AB hydrolase-1 domain-containing protein n=1 Tax=Gloeophyllum trabeum (strain ATCC 11539 / FP-39264 / Madison 617) TaxID=670483 RepID=S7RSQ4_GLOTA|nr:uncharacterized protein GLOTRDRAFT_71571 [Gloeophyllum trabeum ATCC 11539]EPQ57705.1 hypothetical protein GLOTRDRAFT_71571 [Gloeophyllum trabeum ATCC 11539]
MIGQSRSEWIFIRLCILLLRSVAPLSILYLLLSWYYKSILINEYVGFYALAEASFFLFVYLPRKRLLQRPAQHPPLLDREELRMHYERCCTHLRNTAHTTGWFFSCAFNDIKRENVMEWLLWAFFHCTGQDKLKDWEAELEQYVQQLEKAIGQRFDPGRNPSVMSMRTTLDPVMMVHRPLVWYMIVGFIDTYSSLRLASLGFKHYATHRWFGAFPPRPLTVFSRKSIHPQMSFWYRPHRSKTKLPVLFIHGIGIGFWPYLPFLAALVRENPDVGILAIEILPISMRITSPPLTRKATCRAIDDILASVDIYRFAIVSHSYGTVITSHLLKSALLAPRIAACLLVDPIPFLLHLPATSFNFLYRTPKQANEWQLWYFASRDPDIARTLSRHFFWGESILWKDELEGKDVAVVLAEKDQIVDAGEVRWYLTDGAEEQFRWKKGKWEVLFYKGLDHSTVFDTPSRRRPLLDIVRKFVRQV